MQSGAVPATPLDRNAVAFSFCHTARSSRSTIAILVSNHTRSSAGPSPVVGLSLSAMFDRMRPPLIVSRGLPLVPMIGSARSDFLYLVAPGRAVREYAQDEDHSSCHQALLLS